MLQTLVLRLPLLLRLLAAPRLMLLRLLARLQVLRRLLRAAMPRRLVRRLRLQLPQTAALRPMLLRLLVLRLAR